MIGIEITLGRIALAIAGNVKAEKQADVLAAGLASLTYRGGASKLFGKNGHKRDEAFSDGLAQDAKKVLGSFLGQFFDELKIEASEYVPAEPKVNVGAIRKSLEALGVDQSIIDAALAKKPAVEAEKSEEGESVG